MNLEQANVAEDVSNQAETTDTQEAGAENSLTDLSSIGKFRFEGKDWTVDDLKKSMLMHSDYTKKTQALSEERKFVDNLHIDLNNVRQNPELLAAFKQIYPPKYHVLVEGIETNKQAAPQPQTGQPSVSPDLERRLAQIETAYRNQELSVREAQVAAAEASIDSVFGKMTKKYPLASEEVVIARAQALLDKGAKLSDDKGNPNEDLWDKIWKSVQEASAKHYEGHYKKLVNEQKQASVKGKDVASGGGLPGQAPKKMSLKEASEHAIATLTRRS